MFKSNEMKEIPALPVKTGLPSCQSWRFCWSQAHYLLENPWHWQTCHCSPSSLQNLRPKTLLSPAKCLSLFDLRSIRIWFGCSSRSPCLSSCDTPSLCCCDHCEDTRQRYKYCRGVTGYKHWARECLEATCNMSDTDTVAAATGQARSR